MSTVRVQYFGPLREWSGRDGEELDSTAATPRALYEELSQRYGFALPLTQIMVAINDRIAREETPLKPGDCVVFIPPIAGG